MRHVIAFAFVLGLSFAGGPATAEPSAAEIAVARRLYGEAVKLEEAGKWAEAETKLREAIAIKETPGLRFHLAVAQEKQGKLVEALVDYDRAHEIIERGARAPDVEQLLGPAREAVRGRIPSLTVSAPAGVDGATLEVDGKPMAQTLFGQAIPLNPGKHAVRIQAPGFSTFEAEVTLAEAEKKTIEPELAASGGPGATTGSDAPASMPGAGADEPASRGGSSTKTVVLIGGAAFTVIALAAGIGFTVRRNNLNQTAKEAGAAVDEKAQSGGGDCEQPLTDGMKTDCAALHELLDDRDQAATFATVGFIAAGVGAVATVATYFLWNPEPSPTSARVDFAPLPGGGFVGLSGAF